MPLKSHGLLDASARLQTPPVPTENLLLPITPDNRLATDTPRPAPKLAEALFEPVVLLTAFYETAPHPTLRSGRGTVEHVNVHPSPPPLLEGSLEVGDLEDGSAALEPGDLAV